MAFSQSYQSKPHMTGESTDTSFHWQMWKWRAEALQSMATAGTGLPSPPARATPAVQPSWALGTGTNWHSRKSQKTMWREQRNTTQTLCCHTTLLGQHTCQETSGSCLCTLWQHESAGCNIINPFPHQRAPGEEPAQQFQQEDWEMETTPDSTQTAALPLF